MRRVIALAIVLLAAGPSPARADVPQPVAAFVAAWAAVTDYTATIVVHETSGSATQDRTYRYAYKKPTFAKIDIVAGPGRGGGAVWRGGDTVKGHIGGLFAGIKLTIGIADARAVSLRGDTVLHGSFQDVADAFAADPVAPATTGETLDGVPTDAVTVMLPASASGETRRIVYLSRTTHLPVRRTTFVGDVLVKQEDFRDVLVNVGLTEGSFN